MSEENNSIKDLTKLTMFFGIVSEVHIKNLKMFPWIYFDNVKEVKLNYDIATKKEGASSVSYDLDLSSPNDNLDKRYKALETSVRTLFWKEVRVDIKINGKEVYKSE